MPSGKDTLWSHGEWADYEVVQLDMGGDKQVYHLNLLKAETGSLVSLVKGRDELGLEVPNSIPIPAYLHWDNHFTQAQRADGAALQQ